MTISRKFKGNDCFNKSEFPFIYNSGCTELKNNLQIKEKFILKV